MDIKAILLDFDGTTLQRDQVFISVRNMYAIRKALDKGIYIVPSTGRAENMQPPQIEAEKRIRYYITSGGAGVVDHSTGKSSMRKSLRRRTAQGCAGYSRAGIYIRR